MGATLRAPTGVGKACGVRACRNRGIPPDRTVNGLDLVAATASAIALAAAWRLQWLSVSGIFAAAVIGVALWVGAGPAFLILLLFFFATSSALSRSLDGQGSGRTAVQVLANGGIAALASLAGAAGLLPGAQFAVAGALATAMSDTWATELGTVAAWPTRLISDGRPVSPGASGGVSWPGTAAAGVASLLFGLVAAGLTRDPSVGLWPAVTVPAGMFGMTVDSFLGATLEDRVVWIDNQAVNLAGTAAGALAGWVAARALGIW